MGFRFVLYIGILFIGMFIGYKEISHPKLLKRLGRLQLIALIFLLFVMGLRIGSDRLVINNIGSIGLKALAIAISTIVFSVFFVWLYRLATKRDHYGNKRYLDSVNGSKEHGGIQR